MAFRTRDETFYWFLTVKTPPGDDTDPEVLAGLGLPAAPLADLNLWPCRKCGALIPGGLRSVHRDFHERIETK